MPAMPTSTKARLITDAWYCQVTSMTARRVSYCKVHDGRIIVDASNDKKFSFLLPEDARNR